MAEQGAMRTQPVCVDRALPVRQHEPTRGPWFLSSYVAATLVSERGTLQNVSTEIQTWDVCGQLSDLCGPLPVGGPRKPAPLSSACSPPATLVPAASSSAQCPLVPSPPAQGSGLWEGPAAAPGAREQWGGSLVGEERSRGSAGQGRDQPALGPREGQTPLRLSPIYQESVTGQLGRPLLE